MLTNLRVRNISGDVSTDDIIPAKYKHMYTEPEQLAPHIFENFRPGFAETVHSHDFIVCDGIFGIGSSREQAVSSMLAKGIKAVIAPEFGRIFYRNAWNLGLIAIQIQKCELSEYEEVEIDLINGVLTKGNKIYSFLPPSNFMIKILEVGGILNYVSHNMQQKKDYHYED
ncbi:hypothetical protein V6259_17530 [Marinomonas sp. TI.3.20]|uniref:LeuD/DmdB family oxidoreductase small subunit n=1 Tax=Marinomonas sp. TI.3.20 TaxID=3121296 RepID=UPI00312042FE